jgi:hypothetical protein
MSQRRQDARRAKQERRRELRQEVRQSQRRTATATDRPRPSAPPPAPASFWNTRNRLLVLGGVAVLIVLALAFWVFQSTVGAPKPGVQYEDQGGEHLTSPDQPHPAYNSNPPTSGWHLPEVPRPGVYTQPRTPESLGHFMEHGGIWVLYNCPDGCPADVEALTGVVNTAIDQGKPVALAPYLLMDSKFAVTAWTWLLTLDTADTGKVRDFIDRHQCNWNPEGGPYCSGVRGTVKSPQATLPPSTATVQPSSVFSSPSPAATGTPAATATTAP